MDPSVKNSLYGARVFYFVIKLVLFYLAFTYPNRLYEKLKEPGYGYLGVLAITLLLSVYFFLTSGHNPGFLKVTQSSSETELNSIVRPSQDSSSIHTAH